MLLIEFSIIRNVTEADPRRRFTRNESISYKSIYMR